MRHSNWRGILARAPLPMLALAASYGVYSYALLFVPFWVAVAQAAAFEFTYIGLAISPGLDTGQRRRATAISIGAVAASVIYNTLAGWFHAQPQLLVGASALAWLCLAVLHGAPLAWVAYLVSSLLLHSAPAPMSDPPPVMSIVSVAPPALPDTAPVMSIAAAEMPVIPDTAPARSDTSDILTWRDVDRMSWLDIAARLGVNERTARRRYQAAKA